MVSCEQLAYTPPQETPAVVMSNPQNLDSSIVGAKTIPNAKQAAASNNATIGLDNIQMLNSVSSTSFTSSPGINSWTNASSGNLNLSCAYFYGGIRAKVNKIDAWGNVEVEIQRTDGKPFNTTNGQAFVKATNPCGSVANMVSWNRTDFYFIRVPFKLTFTSGTVVFYPTLSINNVRYYANPITFTARTTVSTDVFASPVSVSALGTCKFASTQCYLKGHHHTGIDYMGNTSTSVNAMGDGVVDGIIRNGSSDHGLGNTVIIKHKLTNGNFIYSNYSHLSSISVSSGNLISKGTRVGYMGGTGKGSNTMWSIHLHSEMKLCSDVGSCWNGAFYGYSPKHPTVYGYVNPEDYIGKVSFIKN
jgi:hypothetical protein